MSPLVIFVVWLGYISSHLCSGVGDIIFRAQSEYYLHIRPANTAVQRGKPLSAYYTFEVVLRIQIRMFLGLADPDPSIIKQK